LKAGTFQFNSVFLGGLLKKSCQLTRALLGIGFQGAFLALRRDFFKPGTLNR